MEMNTKPAGGSLQISTDAIARIARCAALEIDGVADVACAEQNSVLGLVKAVSLKSPVTVEMHDGIAEITISLIIRFGTRIPAIAEKVQENVKTSVQNMTSVAVSRVNLVAAGVAMPVETAEG